MIDASIPLQGRGINLQEIVMNAERMRQAQAQRQMAEQQARRQQRLGEVLPGAVNGDKGAMNEIAGLDPDLFLRMDAQQREHAAAGIADLGAAVRWADTPEKWAQVQQHYLQQGVDLTPYDFSHRENGMMMLGKLGDYLNSAPKRDLMQIDGVAIDKATGEPVFESPYDRIIPGPNGSFYRVPRMGIGRGGNVAQQGAPPPPPPGFVIDGQQGGPTPQASGGFPQRPF